MFVPGGVDEGFGSDIGAQVDDFQALAFQHHLHQVLANVVQVALHGADADLTGGLHAFSGQQGFQKACAHVHGAGGYQDFGNENFVVLELFADDVHAIHQTLFQNLVRGDAFVDGLLHQGFHVFGLTGLKL